MELEVAWKILGKDLNGLLCEWKPFSDLNQRLQRVQEAHETAKKLAKQIMRDNHPDKVGNDFKSVHLFRNAQEALHCIEYYTQKLQEAVLQNPEPKAPREGLIMIK
jgi:hypothetical protein